LQNDIIKPVNWVPTVPQLPKSAELMKAGKMPGKKEIVGGADVFAVKL
jgi:hypothetical protein